MKVAAPVRSYQSHKCLSSAGLSMPKCSRAGTFLSPAGTGHWAGTPCRYPFPASLCRPAGST